MNEKAEDEVKSSNVVMDSKISESIQESSIELTNKFDSKLRELETRTQSYTEKATRALDAKFKKEMDKRVRDIVMDALLVPELIGKDEPFANFASYTKTFYQQTKEGQHKAFKKLRSLKV